MRLATRLAKVEARLRPDDRKSRLLIVFEDDGVWQDGVGQPVERETMEPTTQVIVLTQRPDGPQ